MTQDIEMSAPDWPKMVPVTNRAMELIRITCLRASHQTRGWTRMVRLPIQLARKLSVHQPWMSSARSQQRA